MRLRKGKHWLAVAICAALLTMLSGCAASGELNRYQFSSLELFDTVTVITGFAEDEASFREKADALLEELTVYHRLCDIYHEYEGMNNAKTINDRAGGKPVRTDARLIGLLSFARNLCLETGGKTDITLGAMLRLWHEAREKGIANPETAAPPEKEPLKEAMAHTGVELLEIDEAEGTVRLTDPEASLDLGAVAKGYAVQRVLEKGAVVTSGDYQRYFEADGKRYHHLIDPETQQPGGLWRSVSVLHEDSGTADGMSTALFLMTREEGEALLKKLGGEACWIAKDGEMFCTVGYLERIRK